MVIVMVVSDQLADHLQQLRFSSDSTLEATDSDCDSDGSEQSVQSAYHLQRLMFSTHSTVETAETWNMVIGMVVNSLYSQLITYRG